MKLKKVMAATLATMMCLSSFSMMNVWADKKEDSEPLVINYISARGETDAALKTLKKLAEDYKKDHPDFRVYCRQRNISSEDQDPCIQQ